MKTLAMVMFALAPVVLMADTEIVNGVRWTYAISNGKARVGVFQSAVPTSTTGAIAIPLKLGDCEVTEIEEKAFENCKGLTSVRIPASVTRIGRSAFYGCIGLTSIVIPENITSIEDYTFYNCSGLSSVTMSANIKSIGYSAFYRCSGLKSLTIPPSVTDIDSHAFYLCSGLKSVTIPLSVVRIGSLAFGGTPFYENKANGIVILGNGLLYAYKGKCPSSVIIPSDVTSICGMAFYGCRDLMSVTIPSSVTSIGDFAFYDCSGLTSVTIQEGVTSIGNAAFQGCSSLESVTIPNGVTIIESSVFCVCDCLKTVIIPAGVTSIGKDAFYGCSGLASITIPQSVTSIGERAFHGCCALASMTIPSSVTSIGNGAFEACGGLRSFLVDSDNPSYSSRNGLLCSKDGQTLVAGANGDVTIPTSVTSIGDVAFSGYTFLESVTIPSSVMSIGGYAFASCSELSVVYVGKGETNRVRGLYAWDSWVMFAEVILPVVEGDEGTTVTGDAETGFVVRPSEGKTAVEVTIPQGVDAAKVTVEVSVKVTTVKPNGAKVKIVSGGADITEFLNVPAADGNGVVDLAKATVKEEIVKETMDPAKGAEIELNSMNPTLITPNTRKGLFYQLREGATLDGMKDGDSKVGDGLPWSPEITVKGGNSAFYSIGVGKGE